MKRTSRKTKEEWIKIEVEFAGELAGGPVSLTLSGTVSRGFARVTLAPFIEAYATGLEAAALKFIDWQTVSEVELVSAAGRRVFRAE